MKITINGVSPDDGVTDATIREFLDEAMSDIGPYDDITIEQDLVYQPTFGTTDDERRRAWLRSQAISLRGTDK